MRNENKNQGSGRPTSATKRVRDYFRERIYGPPSPRVVEEKGQPSRHGVETPRTELRAETTFADIGSMVKEGRECKGREREREAISVGQRRPNGVPPAPNKLISSQPSGIAPDLISEHVVPRLRRVGKFENLASKERPSSSEGAYTSSGEEPSLPNMRQKCAAIYSGKLERVIPPPLSAVGLHLHQPNPISPPQTLSPIILSDPSLFITSPFPLSPSSHLTPPNRPHKHTRTTSNTSTNSALANLATSADLLDEARRILTSTLRRSAEKTMKGFVHRGEEDYPSDDESFYCIGLSEQELPQIHPSERIWDVGSRTSSDSSQPSRASSELSRARNLSPRGTNVWTQTADLPPECRLCRKRNPAGQGGLCLECEDEFKRPITRYVTSEQDESKEEIKPTPPLKIHKASRESELKRELNWNPTLETKLESERSQAPNILVNDVPAEKRRRKHEVRTAEHHVIVNEAPMHISKVALVETIPPSEPVKSLRTKDRDAKKSNAKEPPRSCFEMWQSAALRVTYANSPDTSFFDDVVKMEMEELERTKEKAKERAEEKEIAEKTDEEVEEKERLKTKFSDIRDGESLAQYLVRKGIETEKLMMGEQEESTLKKGGVNRRRNGDRQSDGVKRDTLFYSFYDEILEDAKEKPARRRS